MSRHRWVVGVALVLAALAVAVFRAAEPVSAAPPDEMKFGRDKGLRVMRKQGGEPFYLSSPETVQVGDRPFLSGYSVVVDRAVYIPVSDIDLIEEFPSVESMKKAHNVKGPETVKIVPTTVEKK